MSYPTSMARFPTLRQSRLATADRCLLQAHFEEEYRRNWTGHPQARGQILHRVIARALQTMHEHNVRKIETDVILEILLDTLRQADVDQECPHCGKAIVTRKHGDIICEAGHTSHSDLVNIPAEQVKDLRWEAVKFAHDTEWDIENLVDIEQRLWGEISYPDVDGAPIRRRLTGRLDAWFVAGANDEEAIVLDFKSSWSLPAPTEVGFEGYFQQQFYSWLVLVNFPAIARVTLREFYTRYSETREVTVERDQLEYIAAELGALAERFDRAFEEENFPPSPGQHCSFCPRPGSCPIFPGVRGQGAITDDVVARRVAGEAMVAKVALKQRQDALRAWADVRGPIPINSTAGRERVWGFRESKRTSRPTRDQLEGAIMMEGGRVDLDKLYKTDKTTRFEPHHPAPPPEEEDDDLTELLARSIEQAGGTVRDEE